MALGSLKRAYVEYLRNGFVDWNVFCGSVNKLLNMQKSTLVWELRVVDSNHLGILLKEVFM